MKLRTTIAVLAFSSIVVGCGVERSGTSAQPTEAAFPTAEPTTAPKCSAARFEPTYLPGGVAETDRPALIGQPEWSRTWSGREVFIQVLGGISADRGDDPEAKDVDVRGRSGQSGPTYLNEGTKYFVVDWTEDASCGPKQYAVITKGLAQNETEKIANSLKDADMASSDY